jgi:prolyl oligopeptidase
MAQPTYPPTKKVPVEETLHGRKIVDDYRWLEDGDNPDTLAWVEAQNKFTQSILSKYPAREQVRKRLAELLDLGSLSTPQPAKGKYFFTRREGKQNQPILYVRDGVQGKDRVLVDPNEFSKDGTVAIDWWHPSKDGKLVAYGVSKDGSERSTLYLRDVATGKDLPDQIPQTRACSIAWLPDTTGFYYTRYPMPGTVAKGQENYHRHVFFHKIGDDPTKDPEVFGQGRPGEDWPQVTLSPDGHWLAIEVHRGWDRSEIYVRDEKAKESKFITLVEGVKAIFDIRLRNDRWYVRTNDEAPRYRIYRVDPAKWGRDQWTEIVKEGDDVLDGFGIVGDTIVAEYIHKATSRLRFLSLGGQSLDEVKLPVLGTLSGLGYEADGTELFYGFQSFTMAPTIYHVSPLTAGRKLPEPEVWGRVKTDFDPAAYQVDQVTYKSKDGTPVTMFLAHKKGVERNGKQPTLLYGYGGFNISLTPTFNPTRFVYFLERGGVVAVANLRGGGEYGEEWHRAGMLDKKQNTFDDFIAAAEWLIANKVTDREHLAIMGGSNGGLLMGAAVTQRPELFKAVVCAVPLLDMTRFHKFLIARLWIPEYGNPEKAKEFEWLYAYSPYHKVKDGGSYPAMLITTAASDSRVDPLHARKMVARMQAASVSVAPILLRQETRAGHGQGKPRGLVLEEQTDVWSFVLGQLGMQ